MDDLMDDADAILSELVHSEGRQSHGRHRRHSCSRRRLHKDDIKEIVRTICEHIDKTIDERVLAPAADQMVDELVSIAVTSEPSEPRALHVSVAQSLNARSEPWTDAENAVLRSNGDARTGLQINALMKLLPGRSYQSIHKHQVRMGLRSVLPNARMRYRAPLEG